MWAAVTRSADLRRGRGQEQVDARVVGHHDALEEVRVHGRRADDVHDALAIEAQVQEHPVVAELEVPVHQADPPAQALEGDGGVDRDRRRADAALGPVVGVDPAHRRAPDDRLAGREARHEALHPRQQLGRMERLDQVVVCAGPQGPHLLLHVPLGREHDDRDVHARGLLGADADGDLVAVEVLQRHVEEDERRDLLLPEAETLGAVTGDDDLEPLLPEGVLEKSLDAGVVVDDEYLSGQSDLLPRHRHDEPALGPRGCLEQYRGAPRPLRTACLGRTPETGGYGRAARNASRSRPVAAAS